jgi:hypothetical protein
VALNSGDEADVRFSGHGWWLGPTAPQHAPSSLLLGPTCAGILAFNEAFKLGYGPVLGTPTPTPVSGPGWSLLDLRARALAPEDLEPLETVALPHTALVGCGAIGQAVAFVLHRVPVRGGPVDLVDPQTLSANNLQRYLGTTPNDVRDHVHKVPLAARQLPAVLQGRQWAGQDWAAYRRARAGDPAIVLSALDSAGDRRLLQGSLPHWIVNGWTRMTSCGVTSHDFIGAEQCLVCTYLPATPGASENDMVALVTELGLQPMRVVALLAGSSLHASDLRTIERRRGDKANSLDRWRGESIRQLYGHLCGMAEIPVGAREHYVVPFAQASAFAGALVVTQYLKLAAGFPWDPRPIDIDLLHGPGELWQLPPARKDQHPVDCICKDAIYLAAHRAKWAA